MTVWSLQLFLKLNWNTNFCQSSLPLEPPPPFLPAFLACFPLLFGKTNLVLSFCTSQDNVAFCAHSKCLGPHQSRRRLALLVAQHAAPSECRRMEDGLWAPSQAVLSAVLASLHQSVGFPGCDHPARLLWKFCWQSSVDQEPEKNTALSLSGGMGRLAELPTLRGMTFGEMWPIPPRHEPRLGSARVLHLGQMQPKQSSACGLPLLRPPWPGYGAKPSLRAVEAREKSSFCSILLSFKNVKTGKEVPEPSRSKGKSYCYWGSRVWV